MYYVGIASITVAASIFLGWIWYHFWVWCLALGLAIYVIVNVWPKLRDYLILFRNALPPKE